jgi:hypothetical protein
LPNKKNPSYLYSIQKNRDGAAANISVPVKKWDQASSEAREDYELPGFKKKSSDRGYDLQRSYS